MSRLARKTMALFVLGLVSLCCILALWLLWRDRRELEPDEEAPVSQKLEAEGLYRATLEGKANKSLLRWPVHPRSILRRSRAWVLGTKRDRTWEHVDVPLNTPGRDQALLVLRELRQSSEPHLRAISVLEHMRLSKLGRARRDEIVPLLADANRAVALYAWVALSAMVKTSDEFASTVEHIATSRWFSAVKSFPFHEAFAAFDERVGALLVSDDPTFQCRAVQLLEMSRKKDRRFVELVRLLLQSEDPLTRRVAFIWLQKVDRDRDVSGRSLLQAMVSSDSLHRESSRRFLLEALTLNLYPELASEFETVLEGDLARGEVFAALPLGLLRPSKERLELAVRRFLASAGSAGLGEARLLLTTGAQWVFSPQIAKDREALARRLIEAGRTDADDRWIAYRLLGLLGEQGALGIPFLLRARQVDPPRLAREAYLALIRLGAWLARHADNLVAPLELKEITQTDDLILAALATRGTRRCAPIRDALIERLPDLRGSFGWHAVDVLWPMTEDIVDVSERFLSRIDLTDTQSTYGVFFALVVGAHRLEPSGAAQVRELHARCEQTGDSFSAGQRCLFCEGGRRLLAAALRSTGDPTTGAGIADALVFVRRLLAAELPIDAYQESALCTWLAEEAREELLAAIVPELRRRLAQSHPLVRERSSSVDSNRERLPERPDELDAPPSAALVLGKCGPAAKSAIPDLLACARRPDWSLRAQAIVALGEIGEEPERVIPVLIELLEDPVVRPAALEALTRFGPGAEPAISGVIACLEDDSVDVREAAVSMLGRLAADPVRVVPALAARLSDRRWEVRARSAWALGEFGKQAHAAIAQLEALNDDPDGRVARQAARSLRRIR